MDDWSPPLAWELHSEEGPRGDATWLGGRQLELNTGPGLKGMLEAEIAPMLDMPGIGELLTDFFAALRAVSGGVVWATPVPREILLSVLSGGARYQRNEFPRSVDPDTLLAWTLAGKLTWEVSDKTLPGDPPMFKAGGTLRDRECWLVLASKPADPRLMFLSISLGATEAPRFVEQRDRPFRRSALGKLFAHLRATVTGPPRKPRTGEEPAGDDDAEPHQRGYGYTPENPIRLGGRLGFGAVMQHTFFEELRGPGGEPVRARRLGSTARGDDRGSGPLDIYEVTYDGQPSPARLLLDMYSRGAVTVPQGFTRGDGLSSLIGKARAGATPGEAVRHAEAALEVARRKPSDGVRGMAFVSTVLRLADDLVGAGAAEAAERFAGEATDRTEEALGAEHPVTLAFRAALARFPGDPAAALRQFAAAREVPDEQERQTAWERERERGQASRLRSDAAPSNQDFSVHYRIIPGGTTFTAALDAATRGRRALGEEPAGLRIVPLAGFSGFVRSISPSVVPGRVLVVSGDDVELWHMPSGVLLRKFSAFAEVSGLAELDGGARLVTCHTAEDALRVWDVATGRSVRHDVGGNGIPAMAHRPPGSLLYLGGGDGRVRVFDPDRLRVTRVYDGLPAGVESIAVSAGGERIAAADLHGTAMVWDARSGRTECAFEGVTASAGMAFGGADRLIVAGPYSCVEVWRIPGARMVKRLWDRWTDLALIEHLAVDPAGSRVMTVHRDGRSRTWDLATATLLHETHGERYRAVALTAEPGRVLAVVGDAVVDADRARSREQRTVRQLHSGRYLAFSPDGRWLFTAGEGGLHRWDLDACGLYDFADHPVHYGLAMSRELDLIVLARHHDGGNETLIVEPGPRGVALATPLVAGRGVGQLALTADGSLTATVWHLPQAHEPTMSVWHTRTRQRLRDLGVAGTATAVRFVDDHRLLVAGEAGLELREVVDGDRTLRRYDLGSYVRTLTVDPAGRCFAAVSDGQVHIVDVDGGRLERSLDTGTLETLALAFSADGRLLATGGGDRIVRLWDVASGELLESHAGHTDWIAAVAISPSGRHLASCGDDGTVRLWQRGGGSLTLLSRRREWLAFSDSGWFDGSALGTQLAGAVRDLEPFSLDQLAAARNRPDLLMRDAGLGDPVLLRHFEVAHERRLRKLGLPPGAPPDPPTAAPAVRDLQVREYDGVATVEAQVTAGAAALSRYQVFVNGMPCAGAPIEGRATGLRTTVELPSGTSQVELEVWDGAGLGSLRAQSRVTVNRARPRRIFYAGFGVSRYRDESIRDLSYAGKDAADLAGYARAAAETGYFSAAEVRVHVDHEVTREAFRRTRAWLETAAVDDTVVVLVAGHGSQGDGDDLSYYFHPFDAVPGRLAATAVDFATIAGLFDGLPPLRRLLLVDTCESGERLGPPDRAAASALAARGLRLRGRRDLTAGHTRATSARRSFPVNRDRYVYSDVSRGRGVVVFASSLDSEYSIESPERQNGIFTAAVLDALADPAADHDGDGLVDLADLKSYVERVVPEWTGAQQHPTLDRGSASQDLRLPLAPRA